MAFDRIKEEQERIELLEEIRKRAEDAELARIEAEEAKLAQSYSGDPLPQPSLRGLRLGQLNPERRLDDVAPPQSADSNNHNPVAHGAYLSLHPHGTQGEEARPASSGQTHATIPQTRQPKSVPEQGGLTATQKKQRIGEFLASAQENYNNERYNRALLDLESLFEIDSSHAEANRLYQDVEKAKALSDLIHEEEQRRSVEPEIVPQVGIPQAEPAVAQNYQHAAVPPQRQTESTQEPSSTLSLEEPPTVKETFRKVFILAGLLLCGIAAIVVYNTIFPKVFPKKTRLLVLPPVAKNVGDEVAIGLMDELISYLSHVNSLNVYSTNTSFGVYNSDGVKVANQHNADYVLQWSLSEIDGVVNAKISLIDAATSSTLLDMPFRILRSKLAGFSAGVVPDIAQAFQLDASRLSAFRVTSSNQTAYDTYATGRFLLHHPRLASLDSTAAVFAFAAAADPSFPFAETLLGWTNILQHTSLRDTSAKYLTLAGKSLQRAMNLGDGSSQAYRLWGAVEFFRGNYPVAIQRLEQATGLAPSDGDAHWWLALAYLHIGENERALAEARAAAAVNPRNAAFQSLIGLLQLFAADPKLAIEAFESAHQLRDDGGSLYSDEYLAALVAANQHERALDILRKRVNADPRDFVAQYDRGRMLQLAGKSKGDWEAALRTAKQTIVDTLGGNTSYALAHSYLALVETRLGNFSDAAKADAQAITLAPLDIDILYNSARVVTLQRKETREIFARLERAAKVRFVFEKALDLDFLTLRKDPLFVRKIVQ